MSAATAGQLSKDFVVPDDWGNDPLATFIEDARKNTILTFAHLRPQYKSLLEIHRIFLKIADNMNECPELIAISLLLRTHSAFLGAVRLCLSGQNPEAYMLLRGCLESALYSLYMVGNTQRQEIWVKRHDDDAARKECQNVFQISKAKRHLELIDRKAFAIVERLYEVTIDHGGHPNQRSVLPQLDIAEDSHRVNFKMDHLQCGNIIQIVCLKLTTQVGICCLDILYHVLPHRFRILGIDVQLDELRKGF